MTEAETSFEGFCRDSSNDLAALNARLLAAHAAADKSGLVGLYAEAADAARDVDGECFFLTHAYVFALDLDDPRAVCLRARLVAHGRDE